MSDAVSIHLLSFRRFAAKPIRIFVLQPTKSQQMNDVYISCSNRNGITVIQTSANSDCQIEAHLLLAKCDDARMNSSARYFSRKHGIYFAI